MSDQTFFAGLSGDFNPIHLNPLEARRLLFGDVIVHGIHLVLWALDGWLQRFNQHPQPLMLRSLNVAFLHAVRLGEDIECCIHSEEETFVKLEVKNVTSQTQLVRINLNYQHLSSISKSNVVSPPKISDRIDCQERNIHDSEALTGKLYLYLDEEKLSQYYPAIAKLLPAIQTSEILASSRLVGMQYPGLHSIFESLDFQFEPISENLNFLGYEVSRRDFRFSSAWVQVQGPTVKGLIKVFFRPSPCRQSSYKEIIKLVNKGEFKEQRALVIGGSRGLGEVTAKLLAAGGADVKLTYALGVKEAEKIVHEIREDKGKAACFMYDVLNPPAEVTSLFSKNLGPTHLYYFATPFIFSSQKGYFSKSLFDTFCSYYLWGFLQTVQLFSQNLCSVFYPSSVAVSNTPNHMGEYASAKGAGEVACNWLEQVYSHLLILKPRLPRLLTDQTGSLLTTKTNAPELEMLKYLRANESN